MTSDYVSYVLGLQGWERIQNENTPGTRSQVRMAAVVLSGGGAGFHDTPRQD